MFWRYAEFASTLIMESKKRPSRRHHPGPIERVSRAQAVLTPRNRSSTGRARDLGCGGNPPFLFGAKIAASLFHPGVAGAVESGELQNGSAFAVFEDFAGESLRAVLRQANLSLLDQIRIARQTAEAVHAIHLAGLLHGGLRPETVTVSGLGTDALSVKVHNIDLGSAFANGILANRFSMDSSLDSLKYFAPERFRGEPATAQSDVYSLGSLLYELLSGMLHLSLISAAPQHWQRSSQPKAAQARNRDFRSADAINPYIFESLQKQALRKSTADLFAGRCGTSNSSQRTFRHRRPRSRSRWRRSRHIDRSSNDLFHKA